MGEGITPTSLGDEPVIDRSGTRYRIGHTSDAYGIWDRAGSPYPIVRFSLDADGWKLTWAEFQRLEALEPTPPPPRRPSWRRRLKDEPWETIWLPLMFVVGMFAVAMWQFLRVRPALTCAPS
jgi:hypothetical protein